MTQVALGRPLPPDDHLARPHYRPDIDGLRALAVLSVVGFHFFPDWVKGGFIGVDVFFVISGFLITGIVIRGLATGEFSFAAFYSARVRRIFSALAVVLGATLAAGWLLLVAGDYRELGKHIAGGASFISNFVLWGEAGYFTNDAETKPLLHLWSLGIEEQFYLLWPLLLFLAWKRRFDWLAAIGVIIAASFAYELHATRHDAVASFYSPVSRFWELLVGSLLACLAQRRLEPFARHRNLSSAMGCVLLALALVVITRESAFPGWWALLPTLGAFLVVSAGPEAWINEHLFANGAAVWVGLISYPLYLWHWPLLAFARIVGFGEPGRWVRVALVGLSVVLAWLTYVLVERPVRSRGHDRVKVAALCAVMAAVGAAGLLTTSHFGWEGRRADADERGQFMRYYREMHAGGLRPAYHMECNFYDWQTASRKPTIAPGCVQPGERGTWFLWGDSHAQALSSGLRSSLPPGIRLAQVTTAGCYAQLTDTDRFTPGEACNISNRFAREQIAKLRPDVVFISQQGGYLDADWVAIARFVHSAGGGRVVLVGPMPRWYPSLPLVVLHDHWGKPHDWVPGDQRPLDVDHALAARYRGSPLLTYVSLVGPLCKAEGCRATVPGQQGRNLLVVDNGHLSPEASLFVVRDVILPGLPGEVVH